jgi:hypothetical protein
MCLCRNLERPEACQEINARVATGMRRSRVGKGYKHLLSFLHKFFLIISCHPLIPKTTRHQKYVAAENSKTGSYGVAFLETEVP